ncbi:MFS transporter [Mycolicibacterium mengxianglii]|uniref:MFS transporter n=1 Tax=Mycolicibacterium mengxianglii TaxID=2736649 RepID=UPI0018D00CD0|nr:MFS transporter [Mycolicibacterium mengxianglii]
MSYQSGAVTQPVRPGVLIAVLAAAGIAVSMMQTLVIPLVPQLPTLLHTSASNASWAITATLLTGAVATPTLGRLGDMYGPKPILIACAIALTSGSIIAALTSSLIPLIIGRGLQGFGAPIIPLGISVLRASLPPEKVGAAMGLMSASLGVGGALGLPLSAVIAQHFSWHALFWTAAALGIASGALFVILVPRIPAASRDRFDPLGAVGLAAGLVMLLLPLSKGATWGWTSATTIGLLIGSIAVFAVFVKWQLHTPSPLVDVRTTIRKPVLLTNITSIAVGFGMFAMTLVGPQLLQMPSATGYGLGQSMVAAGLWMAPGGLVMMVSAPLAAKITAHRGPKFVLIIGSATIAAGYLLGTQLLGSAAGILAFSVVVSFGVGFAFAALPALINSAVPLSETAAANGINTLARSLGTSTSSAVLSAVLAGMTITLAGHALPSLTGFRTTLLIAAGAAAAGALIALAIPAARTEASAPKAAPAPTLAATPTVAAAAPAFSAAGALSQAHDLEDALAVLGQPSATELLGDVPVLRGRGWLDRSSYLMLRRIDDAGAPTLHDLGAIFGVDAAVLGRRVSGFLRDGLVHTVSAPGATARFALTQEGSHRVRGQRAYQVNGLQRVTHNWDDGDVAALTGYLGRLTEGIVDVRRTDTVNRADLDTERFQSAAGPAARHLPRGPVTHPIGTGPHRPRISPGPTPRIR